MDILIKVVQFFMSLSLLVIIHELGHFLAARMFGIRVEKFYLFFDPWFSIFKFRRGQTEYGMGWLPLGGYVKIAGMIDESMDTEQMAAEPQPDEFRSKPAWQRLIVMVAGVVMNVVLAFVIYCGISYHWGEPYMPAEDAKWGYVWNKTGHELGFEDGDKVLSIGGNQITEVDQILNELLITADDREVVVERAGAKHTFTIPLEQLVKMRQEEGYKNMYAMRMPFEIDSVATDEAVAAGLVRGDRLVALNGEEVRYFDEYKQLLPTLAGQSVKIGIERDSANVVVAREVEITLADDGTIGVLARNPFEVRTRHYSFFESIPAGLRLTGEEISGYWKQIKTIVVPESKLYEELGGFLSIGNVFPDEWDWERFWRTTALLSVILAVMNILPIPALDGGHVLFLLWEVITRRKPSDKFLEYAQMFGLIVLFALLLYANGNDIYRLFIK
ncbi:MAG: RIP metalloprotease RseP [Rikenellaceae bacterium]|nr:RIP metalloprotease RseP [Rikenellaceae bacterium]